MWPVIFQVGPAALQTYTVALSLAFFAGLGLWIREARRVSISPEKIVNLSLGAFLAGLVGGRLLFLVTQWSRIAEGEVHIWALWEGGLVFLGGFLGGTAFLYWAAPRAGISRRIAFDTLAPALAVAHAIGRLGCFANGCCHGNFCPYPWAVTYENPLAAARPLHVPLHPTQIYESLSLLILAAVLLRWNRRPGAFTQRISSLQIYLIGYGIFRFALEFYRGDSWRGKWFGLSTSQWLSLGMILFAIVLDFTRRAYHNGRNEKRS